MDKESIKNIVTSLVIKEDDNITDDDLKKMIYLEELTIHNKNITNAGIAPLINLRVLYISQESIITEIESLINLKELYVLPGSIITYKDIKKLIR